MAVEVPVDSKVGVVASMATNLSVVLRQEDPVVPLDRRRTDNKVSTVMAVLTSSFRIKTSMEGMLGRLSSENSTLDRMIIDRIRTGEEADFMVATMVIVVVAEEVIVVGSEVDGVLLLSYHPVGVVLPWHLLLGLCRRSTVLHKTKFRLLLLPCCQWRRRWCWHLIQIEKNTMKMW